MLKETWMGAAASSSGPIGRSPIDDSATSLDRSPPWLPGLTTGGEIGKCSAVTAPNRLVPWLRGLTTPERLRVASLPTWTIVGAGLSIDRGLQKFELPRSWPSSCQHCGASVETFLTEADFRYHFDQTHNNFFRNAVLREYRCRRHTTDISVAFQALQFCGPEEIVDFSSCSRLCYIVCESTLCFPPFGKAVYSTINRTAVLSERASSLAQVTGNVLRSSTLRLKRARAQLTTLVRGNRVHFLSSKIPSGAQSRVAQAVVTLLRPDDTHIDQDAYRKLCRLMTADDRTASEPAVEARLSRLDHISVPQDTMKEFEVFVQGIRSDLRLSSNKSDAGRTSASSRGMDRWTVIVAQFLVAFSAYFYAADFAVAANTHLVQTVEARDRSMAMKERIKQRSPRCKAWSEHCFRMQHSLERRDRHLRLAKEAAKEIERERVASLARLAARGYPEHLGHWNVHALLTAHGGDWEAVLAKLRLDLDADD